MDKYIFDVDATEKELIILLSVLNSSKKNHLVLDAVSDADVILPIFVREEFIVQEALIASAIRFRLIDDVFRSLNKRPSLHHEAVGCIKSDKGEGALDFREACNKIIHAREFITESENSNDGTDNVKYYIPFITLRGTQGKQKWLAKLDVEKYVTNGLCLIKTYDEDWEVS